MILNEKIKLDPKRYIVSKTDTRGILEYGNDYFVQISGYDESELIGRNHNVIRHPDMPKIIFKLMWERLQNNQSIFAVVKNKAKDGRYYWVITEFEAKNDPISNQVTQYTAFRKAASDDVIEKIELLYAKLKAIEDKSGIDAAHKYLSGYLDDKGQSYDQYIDELIKNRGLFAIFFKAMKKFFR